MRVRKARKTDFPHIIDLARRLDLDYPGMEKDRFWVADEDGRIVGIVALKKRPDCLELCALGVDPGRRGKGIGKMLVEALVAGAAADVHLATIIPGFFETCGFTKAPVAPACFARRQNTAWCEGCDRRLCNVMVRRVS